MPESVGTDELVALILPWAKEHRPTEYQQTLAVAAVPSTFERYMLRLVELRAAEDPAWVRQVPLWVLEETGLVVRVTVPLALGGQTIEIRGKRAAPRRYGFEVLRLSKDAFAAWVNAAETLDLELIEHARRT